MYRDRLISALLSGLSAVPDRGREGPPQFLYIMCYMHAGRPGAHRGPQAGRQAALNAEHGADLECGSGTIDVRQIKNDEGGAQNDGKSRNEHIRLLAGRTLQTGLAMPAISGG